MKEAEPSLYLEIGPGRLKALQGEEGMELPLERETDGRLTLSCREKIKLSLGNFLRQKNWPGHGRVFCAIGARGVTMRRLALPAATRENLARFLELQIESEFPLPPEELAWGYTRLSENRTSDGDPQEFLVVAVKKGTVEEYAELLRGLGATPSFTVAALARSGLCPQPLGTCAVLDIGRDQSELLAFEEGTPASVRILPWGGEDVIRALVLKLGVSREEAEQLKLGTSAQTANSLPEAITGALEPLVSSCNGNWRQLYVTGESPKDLATLLEKRLGNGMRCELVQFSGGEGRSAATLGLRKVIQDGYELPVELRVKYTNGMATAKRLTPWKWTAIAASLALALLLLPTVESFILKPRLEKRLAALQADKARLPVIDRELDFLKWLKQNQPPYLDALYLLAKAAPQGARLESINMSRRGDLAWRGSMQNAQQLADFRSKLIASGFFTNVAVEEQSPTPDRQKLSVRMAAQWRPLPARMSLAVGPTAEEIEKSKTRKRDQPGAMPGMGGEMPMPMPMPSPPPTEGPPPPRRSKSSGSPAPTVPPSPGTGAPLPGGPGTTVEIKPGVIMVLPTGAVRVEEKK